MKTDVKIPEVGESVKEAVLSQWYRRDGDFVRKGEILFIIETDKVTLEVVAEADGVLRILVSEGATAPVGSVVGTIETESARPKTKEEPLPTPTEKIAVETRPGQEPIRTAEVREPEVMTEVLPGRVPPVALPSELNIAPSALSLAEEYGVDLSKVQGTGPAGRITRGDVLLYLEELSIPGSEKTPLEKPIVTPSHTAVPPAAQEPPLPFSEQTIRKPMSRIRQRIAERLVNARQTTAMLTTFNEVDMSHVQAMRSQFREGFKAKYGVNLGIMSFFIKASVAALKEYPTVNAFIDGQDIITHHYYHIGVAIGAERGLVVPVIRHADRLSHAELEKAIVEYVKKIQENRLALADLEGGTFTISNGGVYGSLLSTPILNTPQSGILGLHKIEDRPVAVAGQVVIRPIMYVALTYDHRIIDGREAVSFLKRIKECVEDPERIMLEI
jgi:2-oxoglutarate dehydrogenase E2 component (dihydrolipoamide succinyltransferase)